MPTWPDSRPRPRHPAAELVAGWLATDPRYLASKGRPVPLMAMWARTVVMGRTVTAISRTWRPGDSGADGTCRRCQACRACADQCLVIVDRPLGPDQVLDFALVDLGKGP